jgi:hypothetical protein
MPLRDETPSRGAVFADLIILLFPAVLPPLTA